MKVACIVSFTELVVVLQTKQRGVKMVFISLPLNG